MKYLAVEKEIENADWSNTESVLKDEAQHVYNLYLDGIIREIYFNDENCAVLLLECENKTAATELLAAFPLVKAGLILFELSELRPYTGLKRLFQD